MIGQTIYLNYELKHYEKLTILDISPVKFENGSNTCRIIGIEDTYKLKVDSCLKINTILTNLKKIKFLHIGYNTYIGIYKTHRIELIRGG